MSDNILTAALNLDEAIFKLGRAIRILESHSLNQPASNLLAILYPPCAPSRESLFPTRNK